MRANLRKVGNSRGIIIPAKLLVACKIEDEVEIRMEGKSLLISPVKAPRSGWFDNYKPGADANVLPEFPADEENEEWTW